MTQYEYKVVPAPAKGEKLKGVKAPEARFALSIEGVLNAMGAQGWEYQRAELLPSEERSGFTGTVTNWRNVLVFRRPLGGTAQESASVIAETGLPATDAARTGAPAMALAANTAPPPRPERSVGPAERTPVAAPFPARARRELPEGAEETGGAPTVERSESETLNGIEKLANRSGSTSTE